MCEKCVWRSACAGNLCGWKSGPHSDRPNQAQSKKHYHGRRKVDPTRKPKRKPRKNPMSYKQNNS